MNRSLSQAASSYFSHLARHFPVMCASDEFHFMPRAQEAAQYYDCLDDLRAGHMEEHLNVFQEYQAEFRRLSSAAVDGDVEDSIDGELLQASVAGILLEFSRWKSWMHNPLTYLKIAFIGLDHALHKPCDSATERIHRFRSRLDQVPRLLNQAVENLSQVPEAYREAALHMACDCETYLREIQASLFPPSQAVDSALDATRSALHRFMGFLGSLAPAESAGSPVPPVELVLRNHFASLRNLREVYELAREEWFQCLGELKRLQHRIDAGRSWEELYHACTPRGMHQGDVLTLYRREMESLRAFFQQHGFAQFTGSGLPEICSTPTYLQSVRSSASFSAAFTTDDREKDFFYITTELPGTRSREAAALLMKRLHREFRFLTAHETFPGHFLLDSTRRRLSNPVRRQIESPLFYEGWAYYTESLLTECGYVEEPLECLVDWKRRLWRAGRCQVDAGLNTGLISWEEAVDLITGAGFSREEAENQVGRFRLNPGYQLCYSLGRYEIVTLRERYGAGTGRDRFHRVLLEGGEIPFHCIEKRLQWLASLGQ